MFMGENKKYRCDDFLSVFIESIYLYEYLCRLSGFHLILLFQG